MAQFLSPSGLHGNHFRGIRLESYCGLLLTQWETTLCVCGGWGGGREEGATIRSIDGIVAAKRELTVQDILFFVRC